METTEMAKPDNPGKPDPTGTIERTTAEPRLGDPCTFVLSMTGVKPPQNVPGVYLDARQDDVTVYGETIWVEPDQTSVTFTMGGGSSDWLDNTPPADRSQPATCTATLFWRDNKVTEQHALDVTEPFEAAGLP